MKTLFGFAKSFIYANLTPSYVFNTLYKILVKMNTPEIMNEFLNVLNYVFLNKKFATDLSYNVLDELVEIALAHPNNQELKLIAVRCLDMRLEDEFQSDKIMGAREKLLDLAIAFSTDLHLIHAAVTESKKHNFDIYKPFGRDLRQKLHILANKLGLTLEALIAQYK